MTIPSPSIETTNLGGSYTPVETTPLDSYTSDPRYDPKYAEDKANKFLFTLDETPEGPNGLMMKDGIVASGPKDYARLVVQKEALDLQTSKNKMVNDFMNKKGGEVLSGQDVAFIQSLSRQDITDLQNAPDEEVGSIANKIYAKKVSDKVLSGTDYSFNVKLKDYLAPKENDPIDMAEKQISWNETVNDTVKRLEAEFDQKSILGKGYEYGEQFVVPFASQLNQRDTITKSGPWLLGNNKKAQYQHLFSLPFEQRGEVFRKAVSLIAEDNLLDAIDFARGALGYSENMQVMENAGSALELTTAMDAAEVGLNISKKSAVRKAAKAAANNTSLAHKNSLVSKAVAGRAEDGSLNASVETSAKKVAEQFKKHKPAPMAPRGGPVKDSAEGLSASDIWGHVSGSGKQFDSSKSQILQDAEYAFSKGFIKSEADIERHLNKIKSSSPVIKSPRAEVTEDIVDASGSIEATVDGMRSALSREAYAKNLAEDMAEAAAPNNPNAASDLYAVSGDTTSSATMRAQKINDLHAATNPPTDAAGAEAIESFVPSMYSPKVATRGRSPIGSISNQLAQKIASVLNTVSKSLDQAVMDSNAIVNRIGSNPDNFKIAAKIAKEEFERTFPKLSDIVLDTYLRTPEEVHGNVMEFFTVIGTPDLGLFERPSHAFNAAKNLYGLKKGSYKVVNYGTKHAIEVKSVVDETKMRDLLIPLDGKNNTPVSTFGSLINRFRSADSLLSTQANRNRKASVAAHSLLQSKVAEAAKYISAVSKIPGAMKRFERVLSAGLNETTDVLEKVRNKVTGKMEERFVKVPGKEWSAAGFQQKYLEVNGQLPTETETIAYEVYKYLNDFDETLRNFDLYSEQASMGYRDWNFRGFGLNDEGSHGVFWSKDFMGKRVDDLPYDHPRESTMAIVRDDDKAVVWDVRNMSQDKRQLIDQLKKEGYHLIQVMNPDQRPLEDALGSPESINFLLVKESRSSALKLKRLPSQKGGHRIPKADWFVKQPKVSKVVREGEDIARNSYDGDLTVYGVHSKAKAEEIVPFLEKARQLFKAGDQQGFFNFVVGHLPRDPKRMWADFEEKILDPDHPFFVVASGEGVNDTKAFKDYSKNVPNLVDNIDSPFNDMRKVNKKFAGKKSPDLFSYSKGSENDPIFKFETGEYLEPTKAMASSMSSLLKSRAYKDMTSHAVNSFIEEFGDLIGGGLTMDELRANPLGFVHNPNWIDSTPANVGRLNAAKAARQSIINLLGTRSEIRNTVDWLKGNLVDSIYNKFGDKPSELVHDLLLPSTNDPISFAKAAAFHTMIGLFSPAQMFKQAQTIFHMAAITGNPARVWQANTGAALMQYLRWTNNSTIIRDFAKKAAAMGFGSADEFEESYAAMMRSGIHSIEGENSLAGDALDPKLFQSKMGTILDKGLVFWKMGDRYTRIAAWNIAFKEWKKLNPSKILTKREDINAVLSRADTLTVNMTKASSADIQKGVFSPVTQFWGYQMRLLGQMTGKQLTAGEKLRAWIMQSAVYGVPVGGTLGMAAPWYDDILNYTENDLGIDTHSGAGEIFFRGGLSWLVDGITGHEYNVAQAYGPGGFPILKAIFDPEDTDTILMITGASGSIFSNAFSNAYPAITTIWSQTMDEPSEARPWDANEFLDTVRSITSVSQAAKGYFALAYGKYFTRNGQYVVDADEIDAVAMAVFGLTPDKVSEMGRQLRYLKDDKDAIKELEKEYQKNMRLYFQATEKADKEIYLRRANHIAISAQLNRRERATWFNHAMSGNEAMVDKIDQEFRKKLEQRNGN